MDGTRFFLILMPWGRVGSNLVSLTLSRTPKVVIDNEPTTRIRTEGHQAGYTKPEMGDQQLAHLSNFVSAHADTGRTAGLKLSHRSLIAPLDYLGTAKNYGFDPIVMTRRNHLKTAVSQLRAQHRAQQTASRWESPWAVRSEEPKPGPTMIDVVEAIRLTGVFSKLETAMQSSISAVFGDAVLRIEYADLAAAPTKHVAMIHDHLGVPLADKIDLSHRKATSDVLADDILNYDEFCDAVRAAGLDHFIEA